MLLFEMVAESIAGQRCSDRCFRLADFAEPLCSLQWGFLLLFCSELELDWISPGGRGDGCPSRRHSSLILAQDWAMLNV